MRPGSGPECYPKNPEKNIGYVVINFTDEYVFRVNGNLAPITMCFAARLVCIMSYRGCMSYGVHFSANQLGGLKRVWGMREYLCVI